MVYGAHLYEIQVCSMPCKFEYNVNKDNVLTCSNSLFNARLFLGPLSTNKARDVRRARL